MSRGSIFRFPLCAFLLQKNQHTSENIGKQLLLLKISQCQDLKNYSLFYCLFTYYLDSELMIFMFRLRALDMPGTF